MAITKPIDIDEYNSQFPGETQKYLEQIRAAIKRIVPDAEEAISYGIPAFNLNGRYLVYFAGYKKHVSIYPVPSGVKKFEKQFSAYKTSGKGTIQFPLDKPLPVDLIKKIVEYLVKKNAEKAKTKKATKKQLQKQHQRMAKFIK
jgi:uncharacterized protein YdhG (YjbR/CyaY superfamily)